MNHGAGNDQKAPPIGTTKVRMRQWTTYHSKI